MHSACFTQKWLSYITNIFLNKRSLINIIIASLGFLKEGIKNKDKSYFKYNRIKFVANEIKYKTYPNKLNRILKFAERKYYSDLVDENKHNIKKTC